MVIHMVSPVVGDEPGIDLGGELTADGWRQQGLALASQRGDLDTGTSRQMWDIGDWAVAGEERVFTNIKRDHVRKLAAEITGYSKHTIVMAVSVARKVPPSIRIERLAWGHHLLVAKFSPERQREWLHRAATADWSVTALRRRLREAGMLDRKPSTASSGHLITRLLTLRHSDIAPDMLEALRKWWAREMATRPADVEETQPQP